MSLQGSTETAILAFIAAGLPAAVRIQGPTTQPKAEGSGRLVSCRKIGSAATRLEFGQSLFAESFALTCFWANTIPRETAALEWEGLRVALFAAVPGLGLAASVPGLERSYIASETWGEAHDGHFRIMSATLAVERVE